MQSWIFISYYFIVQCHIILQKSFEALDKHKMFYFHLIKKVTKSDFVVLKSPTFKDRESEYNPVSS